MTKITNLTPTPQFMRRCIEAWRNDYSVSWAVHRAAEDFGHDGDPYDFVCNRKKTPTNKNKNYRSECSYNAKRWLARFFRPVSDALFDGKSDDQAFAIWIKTNRKDTGKIDIAIRRVNKQTETEYTVRARSLSPTNGSFFRKR